MLRALRSPSFWIPFCISLVITGTFFAWELGFFLNIVPSFPRPSALPWELAFTAILGLLMSVNAGLAVWQSRYGTCPIGVKRASGAAVLLGAFTLICPVCVLLPVSLAGLGFFFAFLSPFLPLVRVIAVVILVAATYMLWPKGK